jgi:Flp pilus assembly protein TadG
MNLGGRTVTRVNRQNNASDRGTAIVEAAIVLPIFLMLLFGIFEATRFVNTKQVLTNAAREGARMAVAPLSGTDTLPSVTEVEDRVKGYLASGNITGATVTVDPAVQVMNGTTVTLSTRVTVQKTYAVVTVPYFFSMLNINVTGEALMRNETNDQY